MNYPNDNFRRAYWLVTGILFPVTIVFWVVFTIIYWALSGFEIVREEFFDGK